jgi:hypothetical protein
MPDEKAPDAVEKFLLEQKAVEDRKQSLIDDLLRERAAAIQAFDDKLAKLGYKANARSRRSHHKKSEAGTSSPKAKPKA